MDTRSVETCFTYSLRCKHCSLLVGTNESVRARRHIGIALAWKGKISWLPVLITIALQNNWSSRGIPNSDIILQKIETSISAHNRFSQLTVKEKQNLFFMDQRLRTNNDQLWACNCSACGFAIFPSKFYKLYPISVTKIVEITCAI